MDVKEIIKTGNEKFDSILSGGLVVGNVTYAFGRHRGSFKTIFILNLALSISRSGIPACIFTLEASNEQLVKRIIKISGQFGNNTSSSRSLSEYPLYLCDNIPVDIAELETDIEHIVSNNNCKVVFIDYLQLVSMTCDDMNISRKEEVCAIAQILEKVAKRLNISIVVNCALNITVSRISKKDYDYRPEPSEFIDSGLMNVISFFKSPIIVTHRPIWYKNHSQIDLLIEEPVEIIRYDSHFYVVRYIPMIFDKNTLEIR